MKCAHGGIAKEDTVFPLLPFGTLIHWNDVGDPCKTNALYIGPFVNHHLVLVLSVYRDAASYVTTCSLHKGSAWHIAEEQG
jgi:hypothetical protein